MVGSGNVVTSVILSLDDVLILLALGEEDGEVCFFGEDLEGEEEGDLLWRVVVRVGLGAWASETAEEAARPRFFVEGLIRVCLFLLPGSSVAGLVGKGMLCWLWGVVGGGGGES